MFDSPQVHRNLITCLTNFTWMLPHELPNDLREVLRKLEEFKLVSLLCPINFLQILYNGFFLFGVFTILIHHFLLFLNILSQKTLITSKEKTKPSNVVWKIYSCFMSNRLILNCFFVWEKLCWLLPKFFPLANELFL